ncbi:MAG: serine hydrolase [Gammaproteobacteria bacterium]|nr:serine hydrolase [Gammaproteobacteria bacterium]
MQRFLRVIHTLTLLLFGVLSSNLLLAQEETVAGFSPARLATMDSAIQADIDAGNIAGIVVAVARHGQIVHNKAYGFADREKGERMTTDKLFRLYSMTKPVTSVALLTLYEQGLFQLTDPLDKYIPQFSDLKVFAGYDNNGNMMLDTPKRKPTIQDAFRHTAGLSGGLGSHPVDIIYREHGIGMFELDSLRQEIDKLGQVPLRYQPGEHWVYGLNHDVQAYLVEVLSGVPFGEYLDTVIFEPLGMHDTMFGVPRNRANDFVRVYQSNGDGGLQPEEEDRYARFTDHHFATLSLSSSTGDYLRFARMLLNGGELDGVRILGRKTVDLMRQNHLPESIPSINNGNGPSASGYGLGVSVTLDATKLGNIDSKGSFGWLGAATTIFRVNPAEDMTYVINAQTFPGNQAMLNKVQTLIYQALVD